MLRDIAMPGRQRLRLLGTRRWDRLALVACAGLALVVGLLSPHGSTQQLWSLIAAPGYLCAAVYAARSSSDTWARGPAVIAVVGAVVLPLVYLTASGRAQMEVGVIERGAHLLLSSGSPYQDTPYEVSDFNPYLPGMSLFGVPHALLGDGMLTSARCWLVMGFLTILFSAGRMAGRGGSDTAGGTAPAVWVLWLTACPPVALPLALGGVDPPVVALLCLALTCAHLGLSGRTGLALGAAAALKWTAWPALPVVIALLAARRGSRDAIRCGTGAAGVALAAVLPFALIDRQGFWENVVRYPFGLSDTPSTAASALPGRLIVTFLPHGKAVSMALLVLAAASIAASLLVHPPRHVVAAADRLTLGLGLAIMLAPASRVGYVIYPTLLLAWSRLLRLPSVTLAPPRAAETDHLLPQIA
ncbi:glycosyltransferase 87 family protein [Kitasatospora sp. NPDC059571]|uniref:glycosyltransferase 87 family protein n=1 Tax=Kitasatospora sp. NPDC059571 TaxID=3346871 RepID=UPI00367DA772